jgi:tRNA (guanine-N7-)-methyltransferase
MRLRRKKTTRALEIAEQNIVEWHPDRNKGKWSEYFGNGRPIHVELGMGKGKFISELSAANPEINYIGIDMYDELIRRAGDKAVNVREERGIDSYGNLCLARWNIERIEEVFAEGEIERIYLNFSDPWPKKRHARRRLTHPDFLRKYKEILNERGEIHFRTDSKLLFEFSLNTFSEMNFRLRQISLDLHREGTPEGHIFTEYELKFVEQGMPIYRCVALVGDLAGTGHGQNGHGESGHGGTGQTEMEPATQ